MFRKSTALVSLPLVVLSLCASGVLGAERVRYDNYRLVRTWPASWEQIGALHAAGALLMSEYEGLGPVEYIVPPDGLAVFAELGLDYEVLDENIQRALDAEWARLMFAPRMDPRDPSWFTDYKDFDQIVEKLEAMAADRPDLVTLIDLGNSVQGRDIWCVRIAGDSGERPAVLFNGLQHAREWIGAMVPMWLADRLVYEYDTNPEIQSLVDRVEFFIVPVVNPDGYVYAWDVDRNWRKNRRVTFPGDCIGVDINRNWSVGWGGSGSSPDPCDPTYHGTAPFSEPETRALRDLILTHPEIVALIDFHNYGQLILSPYGYTFDLPADNDLFLALGAQMHDEIFAVHGEYYDWGPISSTLYVASGGSIDWAYDEADVFAYTIELRPDSGFPGFELPADEIIPTCEENFEAARFLANWVSSPLQVEFPEGRPARLEPETPVTVQVRILAIGAELDPDSPRVFTRDAAGPFVEEALAPLGNGLYAATLPATPCGRTLEYYFSAATTLGIEVLAPADAPDTVFSADVVPLGTVFADDMEGDTGWTVGAPDDDATSGTWERADPQVTSAQPGDDHTPGAATHCWVTGALAGTGDGSYDVDGGKTTLYSPVFDATGGATFVSYWRWYSNDEGATPGTDIFVVDITGDGGASWVNVETVGPTGVEASGGWFFHEFAVGEIAAPTATMQLRFVASDEGAGSLVEALLDDFLVTAVQSCPFPVGDLNCSGALGFDDINPFVLALSSPAAYADAFPECDRLLADCNDDGTVDFKDINPFVLLLSR